MTYRDDHEALHARVQELERDLTRAQQDATQGHEAKQRAEELARQLAKAQRELERLRRPERTAVQRRARGVLVGIVAAVALLGGVGALTMLRSSSSRKAADEQARAQALAEQERIRE